MLGREAGEQVAGGENKGGKRVELEEGGRPAAGGHGEDDGGEVHDELHQQWEPLPDIGVEHAHWGDQQSEGGTGKNERQRGQREEQQAPAGSNTHKQQRGEQDADFDAGVEQSLINAGEHQGFTREVDFGQHGLGGDGLLQGCVNRVHENSPKNSAGEHIDWVGQRGRLQRDDTAALDEQPRGGVGERQDKCPEQAQRCLAVLSADVAQGELPGQLAAGEQIAEHLPQHARRVAQRGFWGVDGDFKFTHWCGSCHELSLVMLSYPSPSCAMMIFRPTWR